MLVFYWLVVASHIVREMGSVSETVKPFVNLFYHSFYQCFKCGKN